MPRKIATTTSVLPLASGSLISANPFMMLYIPIDTLTRATKGIVQHRNRGLKTSINELGKHPPFSGKAKTKSPIRPAVPMGTIDQ
ncbi:MAG: hypothetical protein ACYST5_13315, partial [Planctomycetota bacterium]